MVGVEGGRVVASEGASLFRPTVDYDARINSHSRLSSFHTILTIIRCVPFGNILIRPELLKLKNSFISFFFPHTSLARIFRPGNERLLKR